MRLPTASVEEQKYLSSAAINFPFVQLNRKFKKETIKNIIYHIYSEIK